MLSKTIICGSVDEVKDKILASTNDDFQPTLGIVFASIVHDLNGLVDVFNDLNLDVVGCSAAGEIVNDRLHHSSIAIMLTDLNKDYYQIYFSNFSKSTIYQAGFASGAFAAKSFENPALLLTLGGIGLDANKLLDGFKDGLGKEVPMYGGLAGDDLNMEETFAISNSSVASNGMATLVIDTDKVTVEGLATSGWEPIGGEHTITQAEGNTVYTINGKRAYDVFMQYFGLKDKENLTQEEIIAIQTNYPFQIIREDGDYTVLRMPFSVNKGDGTIVLGASVKQGDKFRFSTSPGFEVIEQTVEEFNWLKNKSPQADAIILFSCIGRHGAFGPMLEDEISGLHNHWDAPLIGFLTYGEIGNTSIGTCEFHNETCSLVVLKEK